MDFLSAYKLEYAAAVKVLCGKQNANLMKTTAVQPAMTKHCKTRICNRHFDHKYGACGIFPDIRLCGRWLKESGFEAGPYIRIAHEPHKIIITVLPDADAARMV